MTDAKKLSGGGKAATKPKAKKASKKKAKKTKRKKKASKKKTKGKKKVAPKKKTAKKTWRRGPQAPGWVHVTLEEIAAFREKHGFAEAATAEALGISLGSLRNWTKGGMIASLKKQKTVRRKIDGYDGQSSSAVKAPKRKKKPGKPKKRKAPGDLAPVIGLLENALAYDESRPFVEAALVLLRARG